LTQSKQQFKSAREAFLRVAWARSAFTRLLQRALRGTLGAAHCYNASMHIVYVLEEKNTHEKYIGYTTDLKRRLAEHNRHKNVSTAHGEHWKLIYAEAYVEKMDAIGREKFLKSGAGWRFLKKQMKHYFGSGEKGHQPTPIVMNGTT
jgi:putative endonuclease